MFTQHGLKQQAKIIIKVAYLVACQRFSKHWKTMIIHLNSFILSNIKVNNFMFSAGIHTSILTTTKTTTATHALLPIIVNKNYNSNIY